MLAMFDEIVSSRTRWALKALVEISKAPNIRHPY
jgi:hypothetical protein